MRVKDLVKITNGYFINLPRQLNKQVKQIRTNSQDITKDDVFICINSGVNYVDDAIEKGAICIISESEIHNPSNIGIIKVDSIKEALLSLCSYIRDRYKEIPIIGITGSVGKSTTKELISFILSKKYNVLKNDGNKNNYIGVSETMFKFNSSYDIGIIEFGMNHLGEINDLSCNIRPNIGIITNIGTSHIGYLGNRKNILKAKMEIVNGIRDGYLIIPNSDKLLRRINYPDTLKCYDIEVSDVRLNNHLIFNLSYKNNTYLINFSIPNEDYINNIILAFKTCTLFNIDERQIVDGINEYEPMDGRMNIIKKDKTTIIDDCYNSSYESLNGVLNYIKTYKNNKIVILGDMLELGKYSKKYHRLINKKLLKIKNIEVLLVGEYTKYIKGKHFNNNQDIVDYLKHRDLDNYVILIKGSRKMRLDEVKNQLVS